MKKLMFLMMVFGLMAAFTGSASAQKGIVSGLTEGASSIKPSAGTNITVVVAYYIDKTEMCVLNIPEGRASASISIKVKCSELKFTKTQHKITSVVNPNNDGIREFDSVMLDAATKSLTFKRGKTKILTIFYE